MICIQQPTSPPPRTTSLAAITAPLTNPLSLSSIIALAPSPLPLGGPSRSSSPTPPSNPTVTTTITPSAFGASGSGSASGHRSRAERSLLTLLEREHARSLSPPPPPAPSRSTSRAASPSRGGLGNPGARDSLIFDVDLATLVERSIALQTSPSRPRARRMPQPPPEPRPHFTHDNTYPTIPRAAARSHPYKPHFSTSPASASATGSPSALTGSDSSDCSSECGCSVHASSVPNQGGMHLIANRPRRSTLPERMARPDIPPSRPAVTALPTPSPPLVQGERDERARVVGMTASKAPAPSQLQFQAQTQPQPTPGSARVTVQPPTPGIASPTPRRPSPQWRPAVSGPKRAASPAQPPPRASYAALAAATVLGGTSPSAVQILGPPFGYPRSGATSPTHARPTTPISASNSQRGPSTPRSTNISVSTTVNVAGGGSPRQPASQPQAHVRHGSASLLTSPGSPVKPILRATSPGHEPSSWPTASAAGPLLSPPPLEVEAFDLDRAARRLRNTAGRVCFDEIALPPPGGDEPDDEERVKRPRLGGRRWSLW